MIKTTMKKTDEWNDWSDAPIGKLKIGDKICFALKSGKEAQTVVVARDHYSKGDIVLWFDKIVDKRRMNKSNTNKGGWKDSGLREWLNGDFYDDLPDGLRKIMEPKKTVQIINGEHVECVDTVFLMSEYEAMGSTSWSKYNGVDKKYPYFESERDRIAINEDGETWWHWLADPSAALATAFCFFTSYGYSNEILASSAVGVAPLIVLNPA